ncbi:hypothetical protein Ade02nite_62050 [Paractinoplanes deccanensis]|uniref:Uncharacterized protein n=1 Tax=Paractinoplanes deccanensis TaxID=113561 RepID=A0ABQ3YC63_9ACTN|nr:hypothetical protein Ade02nite_62050 [Actinoplanes deccanensis]
MAVRHQLGHEVTADRAGRSGYEDPHELLRSLAACEGDEMAAPAMNGRYPCHTGPRERPRPRTGSVRGLGVLLSGSYSGTRRYAPSLALVAMEA